ncbi:MAG: tripartite tricarboxylate transporter TctB family protein [Proteobacteria bacterium]|nr:tripartite tricarboxylate transporter TctB family protein [Pseudomonadota bacterium]
MAASQSSESPGNPVKKSLGGDLVIPVAALAFTLYYFSTIIDSPWTAQVGAGLIGVILIALTLMFFVRSALALRAGKADLGMSTLFTRDDIETGRLGLMVVTVLYIVIIQWGGFTLTTFAFLMAAMLILTRGRNKTLIFILSAVMALGGYAVFILAFDTRFPRGPFEALMKLVLPDGG